MASDVAPPSEPPQIASPRLRVILIAVASTLFLASMGNTVVASALPMIVSELGGLEYITWVVTAFLLASTIGAPISGRLGDMYGRKIVLQAAIGIFLLGSAICALALNMPMLVAGRLVQGYGGGSLIVVFLTFPRTAPARPSSPISRSTVQRAIGGSSAGRSRFSVSQTFRAP